MNLKLLKQKAPIVFIGISGGVDSSVSSALLKEQGYNVVGVFIRTWTPDFIKCTWQYERRDAMRVCAHLDIPFLECNAEKEYKKDVVDYMIKEYKKGNTPNPDIICNRKIKFGVFWNFAKKYGADYIATGHYAQKDLLRTNRSSQRLSVLRKSKDGNKDQVYFLWTLTQDDLSHTLFPIGHLKKDEVRKLAKKYKLPVATKKDSQGICFLGPIDMKDFLRHYIKTKKGNVLNEKGEIIGTHDGAVFFTLGQRHGFILNNNFKNDKPLYIITKDIEKNTITVSTREYSPKKLHRTVLCSNINWISGVPEKDKIYTAQVRYHGELLDCHINHISLSSAEIIFKKDILVDNGQSVVIYNSEVCLGGGIVFSIISQTKP